MDKLSNLFLEGGKKWCPFCSGRVEVMGDYGEDTICYECSNCGKSWNHTEGHEIDFGHEYYEWKVGNNREKFEAILVREFKYKLEEMNCGELIEELRKLNCMLDVEDTIEKLEE